MTPGTVRNYNFTMSQPDLESIRVKLAGLAREHAIDSRLKKHVFLCSDQTEPTCCSKEAGLTAWNYLKKRLNDLGLAGDGGINRSKVNCLRICEHGPIMVIYPDGIWYHSCSPDIIERIIQEHLIAGRIVEEYVFARQPLQP